MKQEKNCVFQYAKIREGIFRSTKIVEDKSNLTLEEAKQLWNTYFDDAAKWIKDGNTVEMVIWINMTTSQSYSDSLQYISTVAESDGVSIWETKKLYFKKYTDVATNKEQNQSLQQTLISTLPIEKKLEMFYDFLYERGIAKQLGVGIDTIVKHFIDEKLSVNNR